MSSNNTKETYKEVYDCTASWGSASEHEMCVRLAFAKSIDKQLDLLREINNKLDKK